MNHCVTSKTASRPDTFDPIDFAVRSAAEAFDQQNDVAYDKSLGKTIMAYMVNVRDTLSEYNRLDALDQAILTFCSEVTVLSPKTHIVVYQKVSEPAREFHCAVFDNLEDAQLWWDSIRYLRNDYFINAPRPR